MAVLFLSYAVMAQKKEMSIAKTYEIAGRFSTAIQYYKKAEARDKYLAEEERAELYKSLIFCYDKEKDLKSMLKYFDKIAELQFMSDSLRIKQSEVLRTLGNYTKAEVVYKEVIKGQTNPDIKKNLQATLDWFKKNKDKKEPYIIEKTNINVSGFSMGIQEFNNGVIIGMPKVTDGQTFYNLGFCVKKDSLHYSEPTLLSKNLTSKFYEGYPALDKGNNILYFTSNSLSKVKIKQGSKKDLGNGKTINNLKIYKSVWKDGEWSKKEELPFNGAQYNSLHPTVTKDGNTLYFTSDMPGGFGGYDIYKVEKKGGVWSKPINLGAKVNSLGDETYPFIFGDVLYFSSRTYFGFGGNDVYKINLKEKGAVVKNLGAPINSREDDFAFTINEKNEGYLSSNRSSKKNQDLIYRFLYLPAYVVIDAENAEVVEDIDVIVYEKIDGEYKEVFAQSTNKDGEWNYDFKKGVDYKVKFDNSYRNSKEVFISGASDRSQELEKLKKVDLQRVFIDGYVIDEETQKGIEGVKEVLYEENEHGELEEIDSTWTDEDGYWRFDVEKDKVYEVEVHRIDYQIEKIEIEPIKDNEPKRPSYTTTLKIIRNDKNEKVLNAENILFELNSAVITKESYPILDQVVGYLKANPYSKVEVGAYTDCTGDDALNLALSKKRAEAVAKYIIKNIGGKAFRVKYKGYGETNPLNPCAEQENDPKIAALNRRVEFKIVK